MTALERIYQLGIPSDSKLDHDFLVNAFHIMREIGINYADVGEACLTNEEIAQMLDEEFEERMKAKE